MRSEHRSPLWMTRYLRVGAAFLASLALMVWVTPVNVPATNWVPFGCGSPAAPASGALAEYVCSSDLANTKTLALVLLVAAGVMLLMSEVAATRWGRDGWFMGVALVAPLAVPVVAWSVASLFLVVGSVAADGTLIRCGTSVAQAADPISVRLCGQLADRRLNLSLGGMLVGVGALLGAGYVGAAREKKPPVGGVDGAAETSDRGSGQ